eukprot:m.220299 g.220299  ORF g.220299 m.220299 type:complete len:287 (-) comp10350_c0_seq1:247-1107(-)
MPVLSAVSRQAGGDSTINAPASALGKFGVAMKEDMLLRSVCVMLERLIAGCDSRLPTSRYGAPRSCDLLEFAEKIYRGGLCAKECFVLALIYGQRILKKKNNSMMTYSPHRSFLVSLMVASKYLDDFYCRNVYFASVAGMTTTELNELELRFCFLLDFELCVSREQFDTSLFAISMEACMAPSPVALSLPLNPPSKPIRQPDAWHVGPARQTVLLPAQDPSSEPLDPSGIWNPLPRGSKMAPASDLLGAASAWHGRVQPQAAPPMWRCDPLGAASAWHARPYCPTI